MSARGGRVWAGERDNSIYEKIHSGDFSTNTQITVDIQYSLRYNRGMHKEIQHLFETPGVISVTIQTKIGESIVYQMNPITNSPAITSHTVTATVYGHKRTLDVPADQTAESVLKSQRDYWREYYKTQRQNWTPEQKRANARRQREYQQRRRQQLDKEYQVDPRV